MQLLVYYNSNHRRFDVVYYTKRIRHRKSSDIDKYNRIYIQSITLLDSSEPFRNKVIDKLIDCLVDIKR